MTNWLEARLAIGLMAKDANEVVVAMPTLPALLMRNDVAVEEPTTNWLVSFTSGLIARRAKGVVVPRPTKPLLFTRKLVAVEEPMTNWLLAAFAIGFTASVAKGDEVPSPVTPVFEMLKRVEVEKLLVVDEMLKSERAFEVEAAKSERSP